ncbi:hypothetical protein L0337_09360 [candidate division KSB1 bacterium]|nr:hypothetical protein [candidate division KSB1 bacterium]
MATLPFDKAGYLFIESLLHPATGLAASREGECYTTIYKNALAAMALLHEGNRLAAERIFEVFRKYYQINRDNFEGLPRVWDVCAGLPDIKSIHWEGETAFLLLALNYYKQVAGSYGKYHDFVQGLKTWLVQRANTCEQLLADGIANMYAALQPFAGDPAIQKCLNRLRTCFFAEGQISSLDYEHVLEHIIRGALVFGDTSGFKYLPKFARSEIWDLDKTVEITAYNAFVADPFINVEMSAQLLLAANIWQPALPKAPGRPGPECQIDLSHLQAELEKLQVPGRINSQSAGLPYFVTERGFPQASTLPIIQPTCYFLFYFWGFNPFAPGWKFALLPGT